MSKLVDVVICGAGSAGVAIAYYLAKEKGISNLLIVDKHPPLTQTSAKSGENYRNWWPKSSMAQLMNHSIDLMEALAAESGNIFNMERHGYAYATSQSRQELHSYIHPYTQVDVGDLRIHTPNSSQNSASYKPPMGQGVQNEPIGADLLFDPQLIQANFPYFAPTIQSVIHARRAGAISAQQLGIYLLEEAKKLGVKEVRGEITAVIQDHHGISGVEIITANGQENVQTRTFINAAGPFAPDIAAMLNIDLPIHSVLQQKIAIQDTHHIIPRNAPFTIFMDAQTLDWSDEERADLQSDPAYHWLLEQLPGGLHVKPEGGEDSTWIKIGWAINHESERPLWEPVGNPEFVDIVLRGATKLAPDLHQYLHNLPKPVVHYAGYYTKTKENLPLIGPMGIKGAYIVGALSGFGTMASCAAGELIANWVTGDSLPDYAPMLSLDRYDDPTFMNPVSNVQLEGEL